ncbi:hypothetical protein DFJ77DRAFT_507720 [Powellomyces hirtus]|nr:hypothetical protein DFJ77DRAFT_507720 [Powellomyces hirtus]
MTTDTEDNHKTSLTQQPPASDSNDPPSTSAKQPPPTSTPRPSWGIPTLTSVIPAGWDTATTPTTTSSASPTLITATTSDVHDEFSNPRVDWERELARWDNPAPTTGTASDPTVDLDLDNILRSAAANTDTPPPTTTESIQDSGGWDGPVRGVSVITGGDSQAGWSGWGNPLSTTTTTPTWSPTWDKQQQQQTEKSQSTDNQAQQNTRETEAPSSPSSTPSPDSAADDTIPPTSTWNTTPNLVATDIQDLVDLSSDPLALVGSLTWDPEEHLEDEDEYEEGDQDDDDDVY